MPPIRRSTASSTNDDREVYRTLLSSQSVAPLSSARAAGLAAVFKYQNGATGSRHRELSSVAQFQEFGGIRGDSRMFP